MKRGLPGLEEAQKISTKNAQLIIAQGLVRSTDAEKILGYSQGYFKTASKTGKIKSWFLWGQDWIDSKELRNYLQNHARKRNKALD